MSVAYEKALSWFSVSGAGTNAGVIVTKAGATNQSIVATHVSGSGDAAALVTVESPSGTVVWRKRFAAAFTFGDPLPEGCLQGARGADLLVRISVSTASCEANLAGYTVANG